MKWLKKLYERMGVKEEVKANLAFLHPLTPPAEREYCFFQKKMTTIGLVILGALVLVLALLLTYQKEQKQEGALTRPAYGSSDETITLNVLGDDGEQEVKHEIELVVPAQKLTEKEAGVLLAEAQAEVFHIMEGLGPLEAIPDLPEAVDGVKVIFYSLSPQIFDDDFVLVSDWPKEETEVYVEAVFSIEGYVSRAEYAWTLLAEENLSIERKVALLEEKIARGDYLSEDALVLPKEGPGGLLVEWSVPEQGGNWSILLVFSVLILFILWFYLDELVQKKKEKEKEQIRRALPGFIHKFLLYLGAGMSAPKAWFRYLETGQRGDFLAREIDLSRAGYESGKSFREILLSFSDRLQIKEASSLCSLLLTDVELGNGLLMVKLKELNAQMWEDKKIEARTKAAGADSKLIIPIILMLAVILAVVMTPALLNMKLMGG